MTINSFLSRPVIATLVASCILIFATSGPTRGALPPGAEMEVTASVVPPRLLALRVRHDRCPICRELDSAVPTLVREAAGDSILFVTLDLSDESRQQQSALLVAALGLEEFWTGDLSLTGSVTFVDARSKRKLSFVQSAEIKAIRAALDKAVAALGASP